MLNPSSGGVVQDNGDNTATLTFTSQQTAHVQLRATNIFPDETSVFTVKKETAEGKLLIGADDTEATRTYTVTVSNIGDGAGEFPKVLDFPEEPQGFTIDRVEIDGIRATGDRTSGFLVSNGDNVEPGEHKTYQVKVHYRLDPGAITTEGENKLKRCAVNGATTDPTQGIYNKVTMANDEDGPDNNDACTTAELAGTVSWEKIGPEPEKPLLGGAVFRIKGGYMTDFVEVPDCVGTCSSEPFQDRDPAPGKFRVTGLEMQNFYYWIQETRAPEGYRLVTSNTGNPITHVFPQFGQGNKNLRLAERFSTALGKQLVTAQGEIINYPILGSVAWHKTDDAGTALKAIRI